MFKSKTHGKVNLKQKITKTILVTMTGVFFGLSLGIVNPGKVQSAPSSYLNFQARLLTNSGAIVPDGNYHVEFKMYDVSSGGSALWTETRTTGNLVSVKSGYLSVYLGQVNAFPGTINWGEEHWLTMNIGGASGSASWDGEMTPRLRLTAVPHAFRADTAGNVNSASTNSASTNSSGVSITSGNAAGATSNSGSISIDSGTATGTAGSISLGASNASALTIGRSGVTTTLQGSVSLTGAGTALTVTNDASIGGDLTVTGQVTATDGLTVGTGSNFINQGSTLFTAVAVSDVAGGGNIGTAAATVDIATTFNVNQTTASQTLTLPNPTTATAGRIAFVNNVGSASFTMYGSVIGTGKSNTFIWNGSSWVTTVSLSGSVVDTVGSVDSQTKSANGAVITGNAIYLQTADIDDIGLVSIAAQTFNGIKTFDDGLVVTTGGATITAGDLAVNSGSITSSSATLTVNAGGAVDIQDNLTADAVTADTGNVAITSGDLTTAGTSRLTNAGALQNITGYTQSSGAFALSGAGNFSVDSSAFDVSTAGAVSGVTTLTASGNINTTAGAFQLNGTDINTAGTLTNVAYENQANVFTQANIFQGNVTLANTGYLATQRAADYSTTGTSDDANLGAASLVRLTGASTQTITGVAGGADGRILTIVNAAAQSATLSNEGGTSTAANRIITGTAGDIALPAGATITLVYDAGASRWRVSGTVAATGGSGVNTIGAVDSQTKSANGAVISGTNLYLQTADIDDIGLVSIAAQTFNGVKTFDDGLVVTTGGATITAGGLTVTAGGADVAGGNLTVDTDTLFVDATNNRVGIGDATPDYKLDVEGTGSTGGVGNTEILANVNYTDTGNVTSGTDFTTGISGTVTRTGATGGEIYSTGGAFSATGDTGGTSTAVGLSGTGRGADISIGVIGNGQFNSGTADSIVGVKGSANTFLGGGTTTNAYALQGIVDTLSVAATISNAVGLQIDTALKHASGTITSNYGVRIQNQTVGASDYGLYIEGADTYALWIDSGATRLDGTLEVQSTSTFTGLTTLNGGLTVEAGDTFTFNTDAITDLTGTGLTLSTGALTVDNTVLDDTFFMQGGNSYGATAVLGTNDANSLEFETGGTTRLTINTTGDATLTGNLTVQGTGASSIVGTLAVTDHVSFGADATIDGDVTIFGTFLGDATASSVVTIDEDITDFSNTMVNGQSINVTASPGSAYTGYISGQLIGTQVGGSSSATAAFAQGTLLNVTDDVTVDTAIGNYNNVMVDTTGDITSDVVGEHNQVGVSSAITGAVTGSQNVLSVLGTGGAKAGQYYIDAGGSAPYVKGLDVTNNVSGGTVIDQYGMAIALQSGVGSTITTAVGLDIADVAHAGTVTNSYGLRVGASSGATNNYGLAVEASATQTLWISSDADNTTAAAGLAFGSSRDTNLYRSAANTLFTDDSLTVAGNLSIQGNTTLGNANTDTLTITGTAVTLPNSLNFDSDTLFIDAANNRIGIGDATPEYKFDVEGTSSAGGVGATETLSSITFTDTGNVTSGNDVTNGLFVTSTRTGATGGSTQTIGIQSNAVGDTGGTSLVVGLYGVGYGADESYGVSGTGYMVGATAVTEVAGVNGVAGTVFGGGLTVTNAFGLQGSVSVDGGASAITNAAGLNIKSATNASGGTITNNYGVRILNQTVGANNYGLYVEGADTYALWIDSGATRLDGATTIGTGLTSGVALTVNNGTSTGNIMNLQDNGTTVFTVIDGGNVGIKTGSNAPTADLTFGDGADRTINVLTRTSAGAGNGLTVVAGAANGSNNAGGVLTLQGGSAGTGNAHGGNVVLTGGAGVGTGTTGLVVLGTPTFQTASVQNFTGSGNITAANVNGNGAILISSNAAGYTATLGDPTITTAGRVVYVTNTGSYDMTLSVNGGGTGNTVTLKPNTTATMIWNGSDWTAAGASSSTDLQAAYDNTATSAGGAEIVLRSTLDSPAGTGGLTIRNNATLPISGGLLEVQSSVGTNLFSVNNRGTELAANGGAETSGTFASDWTAAPGGGTASRTTTVGQYVTGQAGAQVATTGINHGIRNNLSANPVVSTTYTVSFTAKASVAISSSNLNVQYSRDGGTDLEACTSYSTQDLSTSVWTKITCTITTDSTTATNPDLIIRQADATSRNIWIDNLSFTRNDSTTQPSNVQIGGGIDGGPITLFTLDRATAPPVEAGDSTYYGSMYYDITTGSIQCYEADGWGACGSPPDNIITLTPEYTGAVLNGSGVGTMTADFCGNGGGLSVNTTFCASGEARNYYRWTSPQASDQTYSIFVTYKLPSTFKAFLDDSTIRLTAYKDHATNAEASLEVFRKNVSGGTISQCGSTTTITTGTSAWNTTSLGGSGETTCSFTGGDYVIFKINMMAKSNANVYVENLDFTFNNR
jgi:hypothetical protein